MDEIRRTLAALVVDDNEVNRMILSNMLAQYRIRSEEADSGRKAVRMTEEASYDILFVDHLMPEMDGVQTTTEIRKRKGNKDKPIIIALTSDVTAELKEAYHKAGANAVFAKPVEITHLTSLFESFHLQVSIHQNKMNNADYSDAGNELFKSIIETIEDIDYETGLKYAIGNPTSFRNILEVSLKELQGCIIIIVNSFENNSVIAVQMEAHKLKNILANIGATNLAIEVTAFEKKLYERMKDELSGQMKDKLIWQMKDELTDQYKKLVSSLKLFEQSLRHALEGIKNSIVIDQKKRIDSSCLMSEAEYEQSLTRAIYYIRRYEFGSIIRELEKLLDEKGKNEEEIEQAMVEIKNYNYDAALSRLLRIKK